MAWFIVMHIIATLLDWMRIGRLSAREKDLEILALVSSWPSSNGIRKVLFVYRGSRS